MSHGERAHSALGASGMSRWSKCPGSVRLEAQFEDQTSPYAEEGTRAHEVAEQALQGDVDAHNLCHGDDPEDMAGAVQGYLDTIRADIPEQEAHAQHIEKKFDLSAVYPGCFGTADFVLWLPDRKLLRVFDYKHGQGIAVEVRDNPQMQYYALGALHELGYPADEVEMVIVQPRCPHPDGPVRRWRVPAIDLIDFRADLVDYAKATEDPKAQLIPGDHCRFCKAAGTCPALHEKSKKIARRQFRADLTYDPQVLSDTLQWLPVLEAWCKSVREFAYGEAEHGRCPPGFKLVRKQGRRAWANPEEALPKLAEKVGVDVSDLHRHQPLPLGEAKKVLQSTGLKAKEADALLDEYTVIPDTGTALAPEDDRRPPVRKDAKELFDPTNKPLNH